MDTRLLYPIREVAIALGISRSACYDLVERGELAHVRIGRRKLIPRGVVEVYVEKLREQANSHPGSGI